MKKLIVLSVFSVLSTFSLGVLADAGVNQTPAKDVDADNTLSFFVALNSCTSGNYKEKNILASSVGPAWLEHVINGMNKDTCSVTLATPDGRQLSCNFSSDDLKILADQHFIAGILTNTDDNPSKESLDSDKIWTDLKANSCSF